ncbi:hypothetical protein Hrd1104_03390 [Halorhabdus sp. CBA1104]|uniref:DUF5798 family protein n=1 Tax=unclassified Halorhabdus TaxID=2621901 RepID=UPI0012B39172|nr:MULTISPECIES: DUF5798 family protein [unclassified Halorhabdus]QGN06432.1 hypothetical protein Hrd1104_03390 [Halorhabdus sp. CBA1104]
MGFGDTAKKLQKVTGMAEDLYEKMNDLRGQIQSLREELETTSTQVDEMEQDLAEQRALLEALAEQQGLDVDAIVADAHIEDADTVPEAEAIDEGDEETAE